MRDTFLKIIINTFAILIVAYLLKGIHLENFFTAILVAVVLGLFNTFLRPTLVLLTFPITAVTMGLFLLVINAGLVMLAGKIIPGFEVASFWTAFWFSILMSIVSFLLGLPEKIRQHQVVFKRTTVESPFFGEKTWESTEYPGFQDAEIVEDEEEQ